MIGEAEAPDPLPARSRSLVRRDRSPSLRRRFARGRMTLRAGEAARVQGPMSI